MSLNDFPKCITKNESNIPVPKSSGGKKSQVRAQFPELQKYIETIINASNTCHSEDISDKGEKPVKLGKAGNNSMQNENKTVKKRKFNLNLKSEKVNESTKTTVSVSSRENISNLFFTDFEDPRNWEIVTTQNDFQKNIKIEKALKNLFPNPYKLLQIPEFSKTKISMYIEKIGKDDVTLPDVIISEFDAQKAFDSTRVESNFEADYDKNSSQTDFRTLNSSRRFKNGRYKTYDEGSNSSCSDGFSLNATSSLFKNIASDKSNYSTSRQSSLENVKDCDSFQRGKKGAHEKFTNFSGRRMLRSKRSSKEQVIDYDIGKLKLLTITDSDDSSKDMAREKGGKAKENFKNRINTSESLQNNKIRFSPLSIKESGMVKEFLNELNHKHKVNQTEVRNRSKSDVGERKPTAKCKPKRKKPLKNSTEMDDCPQIIEDDSNKYDELKLKSSKPTIVEEKKEKSNASEEKDSKAEDETTGKVDEKPDEVLQFMCDCLKKFRNKEAVEEKNPMMDTDATEEVKSYELPKLDQPPTRYSLNSEQDLPAVEALDVPRVVFQIRDSKKSNSPTFSRLEKRFQFVRLDHTVICNADVPDTVFPDSAAICNENIVHTVEIQNELGGFTEERHETQMFTKDIRLAKSILPLSVKMKKNNTDTYKALKNALEREEKLLSGEFSLNKGSRRKDFFENPVETSAKESHASCSVVGAFKRQHSNFVICVNSRPRNMRTGNSTGLSLCPWTISLNEIPRPTIQPLPYYQNLYYEELKLFGTQFMTRRATKDEIMLIMHIGTARYINTSIGVSFVTAVSKVTDEILLKESENRVVIKYKPTKKSFYVKPSAPPKTINCEIESCQKINLDLSLNLDNQVEALEEAVEKTQKVYCLEQNCDATHTLFDTSTLSKNENFRNIEWNEDVEKKKLHDLLMRTYNVQQKLYRHLKKLSIERPTSLSCPIIQQEMTSGLGMVGRNSEVFLKARTSEDAMVYWYPQVPPKSNVVDKAVMVDVQKIDQETSCDLPPKEEFQNIDENEDSGDDDRSSTYSFKSSNDFSENEKEFIVPQPKENTKHTQFLKNIFNEIETLKNRIDLEKDKEKEIEVMKDETKRFTEKKVSVSCESIKTPNKLLTTVFKGKESLTELSLGLKAVPLAKVSNISVEKRKISENHTKISICISKEKANEFPQEQTTSKEMMRSRLSYYLNSIRPSLSSCHTEYSRIEKEIRRGESEDEDDYKSVMSTLSRPHSEMNMANGMKEVKKIEMTPPKSFTKHRFDFYQKMDTSYKMRQKSNTSCTYKEFEPLKQALTEMQIRMRSIKRDAYFNSNDYYQRALKLAKMSAGYCQSCGSKSVIPQDTFGYYSSILPRNRLHRHRGCHSRPTPPRSSYYSLQSSAAELSDQFCDLDLRKSSSYLLNSSRTVIRNSLNDISMYSGKI